MFPEPVGLLFLLCPIFAMISKVGYQPPFATEICSCAARTSASEANNRLCVFTSISRFSDSDVDLTACVESITVMHERMRIKKYVQQ